MESDIAIIGIGETLAERRSEFDVRTLTMQAIEAAVLDAGILPSEIDGIVTESVVMPATVPHDWVAARLGATVQYSATKSSVGAGTVAAPALARTALRSGTAKYVLCYFGVDWGSAPGGPYGFHDMYPAKQAFEKPYGFNSQPMYFATIANRYRHEYGLTEEQLGTIAVSQRRNSIRTGTGQNMRPMSMSDYLASRFVAEPLRVPDCCLISDGAAAFIMTTADRALDAPSPPAYVRGVALASGVDTDSDVFTQKQDLLTLPGVHDARSLVEADAKTSLADIDFAELYDCFTISCLLQLEDLGFCGKGEGGDYALAGHTALDGSLPVNTHGGLLSHSYLLAVEHVTEAVRQLRGTAGGVQLESPQLGLVTGLSSPEYAALLLGR